MHEDPDDMTKSKEIFQAEQAQNETDSTTIISSTEMYISF
jgi:hypothetical protein